MMMRSGSILMMKSLRSVMSQKIHCPSLMMNCRTLMSSSYINRSFGHVDMKMIRFNTTDSCSSPDAPEDDEEEDLEDMFVMGPAGMEWGGPTRGGRRPEPTRFGDWERDGRASDF